MGAGGAYVSDWIFFHSIKDGKISSAEYQFIRLIGRVIWIGLFVLIISGIGLYFEYPERYAESGKFWAKMTIVGIIFINGIIFHTYHLPYLKRNSGEHILSSQVFARRGPLLLVSGAVSFVSWTSAIVLGAIGQVPYTYSEIMAAYGIIIAIAVVAIVAFGKQILARG